MNDIIDKSIEDYAYNNTTTEPLLLQEIAQFTIKNMDAPQMLSGRVEGRLLKFLVQLLQPRLILEIGTFSGYSALSMAEGLPDDGKIITCEINKTSLEIAQKNFDKSPYGKKIELKKGIAMDTIKEIKGEIIDFSFIDAEKEAYPYYYEEILIRTRPGGVIALDNMLLSGRVLNPSDNPSTVLSRLNKFITNDPRVENVLLTVRDGIQLVRKK